MKKWARLFIKIILILIFIIILTGTGAWLFVKNAPQFGARSEGESLERILKSQNYKDGVFQNLVETRMDLKSSDMLSVMYQMLFNASDLAPDKKLPVRFESEIPMPDSILRMTWFGHSAILLELEGKRILLDPMLGPASSPLSFTAKRFPYEKDIDLSTIKNIDAVVFSHDHYDHLDYSTILAIKDEVRRFIVPLGVGAHLRRWGVPDIKITELDWWHSASFDNIRLTCTPARHFSGRGISDRNTTLWASWVLAGSKHNVYFSGDSGYGPHFKQIGDEYGPFHFAMIECGQYNTLWGNIHMMPEESVQAIFDLRATVAMPIHWGAFTLSLHQWTEPMERFSAEADRRELRYIHPYIGERIEILNAPEPVRWWELPSRASGSSL